MAKTERYGDLFNKFRDTPVPSTHNFELRKRDEFRAKYGIPDDFFERGKCYDAMVKYQGKKVNTVKVIEILDTLREKFREFEANGETRAITNVKRDFHEYVESLIWDKSFATYEDNGKIIAYIFDDESEGREFAFQNFQQEFKFVSFFDFKKMTKNWGEFDNYSSGGDCLFFCDKRLEKSGLEK